MTYMFSVKFHAMPHAMQHVTAIITPVYWYFHCDFQQNIALFCAISQFVLLLLFTENRFFQEGDTGREVKVTWRWYKSSSYPQPTRGHWGAPAA